MCWVGAPEITLTSLCSPRLVHPKAYCNLMIRESISRSNQEGGGSYSLTKVLTRKENLLQRNDVAIPQLWEIK
eukprot:1208765-Amphidinium_carterae.1